MPLPISLFIRPMNISEKLNCSVLLHRDEVKIKHHKIEPKGGGYVFHGAEVSVLHGYGVLLMNTAISRETLLDIS